MLRTIKARFGVAPKLYDYFVPPGDAPRVGDIILTTVSFGISREGPPWNTDASVGSHEASFATIVSVHSHATDTSKATKFYLALIPLVAIGGRQKENEELAAKVAAAREARRQLDEMLAKEDQIARYARLAANNPAARELLDQLQMVDPTVAAQTIEQEALPDGAWYDRQAGIFRNRAGSRMGQAFHDKWIARAAEFPPSRPRPLADNILPDA